MKIVYLVFIFVFLSSCDNVEFKSLYPAYPPVGIELMLLTAGNHGGAYVGDYLLLFRSENIKNSKFGGFLIFVDASEADLLQMTTEGEASYSLGTANGESSSLYNPQNGIDTQLAILFTNSAANSGDIITVDSNSYTLIKVLPHDAGILISGDWFTMRAYLWDSTNNVILEVSNPGNIVQIQ